jgi:hypothetical protein
VKGEGTSGEGETGETETGQVKMDNDNKKADPKIRFLCFLFIQPKAGAA